MQFPEASEKIRVIPLLQHHERQKRRQRHRQPVKLTHDHLKAGQKQRAEELDLERPDRADQLGGHQQEFRHVSMVDQHPPHVADDFLGKITVGRPEHRGRHGFGRQHRHDQGKHHRRVEAETAPDEIGRVGPSPGGRRLVQRAAQDITAQDKKEQHGNRAAHAHQQFQMGHPAHTQK